MVGNILGQNVDPIIDEQIKIRQLIQGSGQTGGKISKSPEVHNYLNNRNAWIKMASGISISGSAGEQKLTQLSSTSDGYLTTEEIQNIKGYGLAQNVVLFNTTQRYDKDTKSYVKRSGTRTDNTLKNSIDKMYGGLGGNNRGLQPVPGITDISIECINRGSIRKATVNLKAYNKFQFGLIELLYLRLGYMVMLEWGWDKYVASIDENNKPIIKDVESTIIEKEWFSSNNIPQDTIFNAIDKYSQEYKGNYSGFFGKVSNFTWKLNTDNTYDITLNLITIGSIIESLKVNIPTTSLTPTKLKEQQSKLAENLGYKDDDENDQTSNPILLNAGANRLNQYITTTILDFPYNDKNYCYLPNLASLQSNRSKIPKDSRYYVRFGTLLEKISSIAIPEVINGNSENQPLLSFPTDSTTNICAYELNLIPLAPEKVIFSPILEDVYLQKTTSGVISKFTKFLKPFAVTKKDKVHYGQLLNCYFNLNFLSQILDKSADKKGNVHLYKFLESLCDAINESTGNTTNLEPAIKDDRSIYFLEQNPIKGFDSLSTKPLQTPIVVYGYNQDSSTFVKNFSFQTKITPDLGAMITIGSSAPGSSTGDINALPFNFWNKGLKNRFQDVLIKSASPLFEDKDKNGIDDKLDDKDIKDSFALQIKDGPLSNYQSGTGPRWGYTFTYGDLTMKRIQAPGVNLLSGRPNDSVNEELLENGLIAYKKALKKKIENQAALIKEKGDPTIKIVGKAAEAGNNYSSYLTNAFGGATGEYTVGDYITSQSRTVVSEKNSSGKTINITKYTKSTNYSGKPITIEQENAKFWDLSNQDFKKQGKSAFKLYLNQINQLAYNEAKPVLSGEGFIPLELSLTLDGMGGIKIYNQILLDTRILPASYPEALKFIATKVNHKVSGNIWDTNITTISIPPTEAQSNQKAGNPNTANSNESVKQNQPLKVVGPTKPISPNQKLTIIDNRTIAGVPFDSQTYSKQQSIEWLVGEMNINTQNTYKTFFNTLDEKYPGYTLIINATYRTYQRSIELKAQNPKNATPGYSPHNYAYGIDMNVKDPNGKVYLKKDRTSWVESGIPSITKSLGMRWGGDFSGYVDCVHFDVTNVTDASIINARKDNEGLPQSQWNTKNTNYV